MTDFQTYRERLGYTRREMARAIGVSEATVWRYEHGKINPSEPVMNLAKLQVENRFLRRTLNEIACSSQTRGLLWWQALARDALQQRSIDEELEKEAAE